MDKMLDATEEERAGFGGSQKPQEEQGRGSSK